MTLNLEGSDGRKTQFKLQRSPYKTISKNTKITLCNDQKCNSEKLSKSQLERYNTNCAFVGKMKGDETSTVRVTRCNPDGSTHLTVVCKNVSFQSI